MRLSRWSLLLCTMLLSCAQNQTKPLQPPPDGPKLGLAWRTNLGYGARLQLRQQTPANYEENLYFCDKNRLLALNLNNGKRLWQEKFPHILNGCITRFADYLYFSDENGVVYAYNLVTRALQWQSQLKEDSVVAPTANEQIVLVQTVSENLYALNAHDGSLLWSYNAYTPPLSLFGAFQPILLGPYSITGFADGSFVIHRWETGQLLSYRQIAVPRGRTDLDRIIDLDATAVFDSGTLYLASYGSFFLALDLQQGVEKWRADFSGNLAPTKDADSIYAVDSDNRIYAFSMADGAIRWIQEGLGDRELTAPILWGGNVVVGDHKGFVHIFSHQDGSLLARRRSGLMPIGNFPLVVNDMLIILDKEGFVSAFKPYKSPASNRN